MIIGLIRKLIAGKIAAEIVKFVTRQLQKRSKR